MLKKNKGNIRQLLVRSRNTLVSMMEFEGTPIKEKTKITQEKAKDIYQAKIQELSEAKKTYKKKIISIDEEEEEETAEMTEDAIEGSVCLASLNELGEEGSTVGKKKRGEEDDISVLTTNSKMSKTCHSTISAMASNLTINPVAELVEPEREPKSNAVWIQRVDATVKEIAYLFGDFNAGQCLILQRSDDNTLRIASLPDEDISVLPGIFIDSLYIVLLLTIFFSQVYLS